MTKSNDVATMTREEAMGIIAKAAERKAKKNAALKKWRGENKAKYNAYIKAWRIARTAKEEAAKALLATAVVEQ